MVRVTRILAIAAVCLGLQGAPFEGWDKAQFDAHRKKVTAEVRKRAEAWFDLRSKIYDFCNDCRPTELTGAGSR